ncbi:MAG: radical SAM protein, partial [Ruminococcus sp.]|nr:radical SAM protein [Ruminococcus sp.]
MDFNILTLGCKVNQYESQAMREDLLRHGFTLSPDKDRADVTVINTCTVTSVSDAKNRKLINRVRRQNPDGIIVLTGCMPQAFPDEMQDFAACDIILGNKERAALVPAIRRFVAERTPMLDIPAYHNTGDVYENLTVSSFGEHTRAFIKIEDGCNRFCSYCIIPYARGRVRSKPLADLKREIGQVAASGYREVVLVGINLSAYGQGEDFDLADAVEAACAVEGIARVRLGSIEPEQMDEALIA